MGKYALASDDIETPSVSKCNFPEMNRVGDRTGRTQLYWRGVLPGTVAMFLFSQTASLLKNEL